MQKSLLILISLFLLSYGFLISAQESNPTVNIFDDTVSSSNSTEINLTKEVAQKISVIAASSTGDEQKISTEQLKNMVSELIAPSFSVEELPTIMEDEIRIKKQDYKGTAEQVQARKKEDISNYIVEIYYIFSSSSPKPLTNNDDLNSLTTYFVQIISDSLTNRNSAGLNDLSASGEKILEQLRDVEVPEDLVSIHKQALQFAKYAIRLKPDIDVNTDDPLTDLANLSKMQSLVEAMAGFSLETITMLSQYGLVYDEALKSKMTTLGVTPPILTIPAETTIDSKLDELTTINSE